MEAAALIRGQVDLQKIFNTIELFENQLVTSVQLDTRLAINALGAQFGA